MDNTEKGVIVRLTNQGLRLEPVGQTSWKDVDSLVGAASKQITSTRIEKLEEVVKSQGRVIEQLVNTLKEIEREGLSIEISESKRTTGGYLAIIQSRIYEQVINLQTEISFRKKNISGQFATIVSDFIPSYSIMQLKKFQLVEEKIHACLERRKGRDFYDLYFLLRANMLSVENKGQLVKIQDIIKSVSVDFTKELKQFLPKSYWNVIKDFKGVLLQEIERYV